METVKRLVLTGDGLFTSEALILMRFQLEQEARLELSGDGSYYPLVQECVLQAVTYMRCIGANGAVQVLWTVIERPRPANKQPIVAAYQRVAV